jgi:hypothetical protein
MSGINAHTNKKGGMAFDGQNDEGCCHLLFGSTTHLSWCHASCKNMVGNSTALSSFHSRCHQLPYLAIQKTLGINDSLHTGNHMEVIRTERGETL